MIAASSRMLQRSADAKGKRRRMLWAELQRCLPRRSGLAGCAGVVLLWVLYTWAVCGLDGDCWLGERVRMVTDSKLSANYDPDEARNKILIYDFAGVRTLKFGSLSHVRQSTAVLGDADKFTMPVACHLAAAVLVLCPQPPKRVLIFGMGGGMLPAFVQHQFSNTHLTVVDLEREVVRLALEYFNVKASSRLEVVISDGRKWIDKLPRDGLAVHERYDLIIQDACAGHPCSLVTSEGYQGLRDRALSDHGILLQNIFGSSPRVVRTMQHIFGGLALLDTSYSSQILIASKIVDDAIPCRLDAVSRAHFLRSMKMGPTCYDHGLRHGQTDDVVSMFVERYYLAHAPVLDAEIIQDADPEVQELEKKRWEKVEGVNNFSSHSVLSS
jgi:spermidine synthase